MSHDTAPANAESTHVLWTRGDWLAVAGVLALALGYCAVLGRGGHSVMYDSFRDMAWSRTIAAGGEVWADPTLAGEPMWYPPGIPLLFAAAARVSGVAVETVYASSALWLNPWIVVLAWLVVRRTGDRAAATAAVLMLILGSLWWMSHVASPMPSIQGTVPALISILVWQEAVLRARAGRGRNALAWAVAVGLGLAATAWVHPVCAVVAAGAVGWQGVLAGAGAVRAHGGGERIRVASAAAVAAAVAAALALPLIVQLAGLEHRNSVPMRYAARELFNPDFALQAHAPLVLPLSLVGVVWVLRRARLHIWLAGWLATAVVVQAPVYLERVTGAVLPVLLPHEFQWHAQLGVALAAGLGAVATGRWLAERLPWPRDRRLAQALGVGLLVVGSVAPAWPYLEVADSYLVDLRPLLARHRATVQWLERATPIDAVVACDRQHGYLVVAGLAGRRLVAAPVGFMNPAADLDRRAAALDQILGATSERELLAAAREWKVSYLVLVVDSPAAARLASRAVSWPCLEPVFRSRTASTLVFRVVGV